MFVQLLDRLALPYRACEDRPDLDPARRVQAILVDDAIGALLVLYPSDHLLDLPRLVDLTGRQLVAVKPERLTRMLSKHDLKVLPGLPPLTSSPCLYEDRLLQQPELFIESGQPGLLLALASLGLVAISFWRAMPPGSLGLRKPSCLSSRHQGVRSASGTPMVRRSSAARALLLAKIAVETGQAVATWCRGASDARRSSSVSSALRS